MIFTIKWTYLKVETFQTIQFEILRFNQLKLFVNDINYIVLKTKYIITGNTACFNNRNHAITALKLIWFEYFKIACTKNGYKANKNIKWYIQLLFITQKFYFTS
jgi:hypothetical protein